MTDGWNRRQLLGRLSVASAGLAAATGLGIGLSNRGRYEPAEEQRLVQVRDFGQGLDRGKAQLVIGHGDAARATREAIAGLGGMQRFIKPGELVVIKPNIGWDRTPLQAANTNPIVVATLVTLCLEARARRVIVTDNSCNEARRCFTRSGIWQAVESAGGEVVLPSEHLFREYDLGGAILGRMLVLVPAVEADRLINVAVAKHHGLSGFTGAMKNLYGVLGGRRNRLHQRIDDSIVDLADFARATLTVMDATRVLMRSGPQGGNVADTRVVDEVVASTDPVAVDAYACTLIGLAASDLPYLAHAAARGLGSVHIPSTPTGDG